LDKLWANIPQKPSINRTPIKSHFIVDLSLSLVPFTLYGRKRDLFPWCHLRYMVEKGIKDTVLDFTVRTGGADLRFLALQPGREHA